MCGLRVTFVRRLIAIFSIPFNWNKLQDEEKRRESEKIRKITYAKKYPTLYYQNSTAHALRTSLLPWSSDWLAKTQGIKMFQLPSKSSSVAIYESRINFLSFSKQWITYWESATWIYRGYKGQVISGLDQAGWTKRVLDEFLKTPIKKQSHWSREAAWRLSKQFLSGPAKRWKKCKHKPCSSSLQPRNFVISHMHLDHTKKKKKKFSTSLVVKLKENILIEHKEL